MFDYIPASDRTDDPTCSICIAHYRGSEILAACLDSVINQDCDFEYEIIVHDDASDEYEEIRAIVSPEIWRTSYDEVQAYGKNNTTNKLPPYVKILPSWMKAAP